jgi:hypothetical protein
METIRVGILEARQYSQYSWGPWSDSLPEIIVDYGGYSYGVVKLDASMLRGMHPVSLGGGLYCSAWTATAGVQHQGIDVRPANSNANQYIGAPATNAWKTFSGVAYPQNLDAGNINLVQLRDASQYIPPGGLLRAVLRTGLADAYDMYFDVDCYAPVPKATNMSPSSGAYRNPRVPIIFSWAAEGTEATFGLPVQLSAKLRYRKRAESTYTEIEISGSDMSYTMPASTLEVTNYEWQVVVTTDGGDSSDAAWYALNTADSAPKKPTGLAPAGDYVSVDESNVFSWQHNIDTGSVQTKADLQYSLDNGAWQVLGTVAGSDQTVAIPADTLPSGRLRWRVRTYNTDDIAGEWSDPAAIVGVGAPPAPIITGIALTSRPAVSWQSLGQVGYQVQIGEYDTGEVGGQAKAHKIPYYLPNGTYTARVRIKGASLLWSAWTEQEFVIAVTGPTKPTLAAEVIAGTAVLTFSATEKLYLLRDGVPIANVTGLTNYTDASVLGEAVYTLRAIDTSDNYTDSDPVGVTVSVPLGMVATLAAVDDLANPVALKLTRGVRRSITGSKIRAATYHHYAGREYPVARYSGHSTGSYELSVAFISALDRDRLLTLLDRRRTMLYRDKWGNRWYVTIPDNGYEQDRIATSITLTMHVTDYVEQIDYEV